MVPAAPAIDHGRRLTAWACALAALGLAALYLSVISSQGTGFGGVPLLFAAFFVGLGLLPSIALRLVGFAASLLAALAASAWLVMAMLTGFSIGIAVLPIAALAVAQLVFTLRSRTGRSLAGLFGCGSRYVSCGPPLRRILYDRRRWPEPFRSRMRGRT